MAARDRKNNFSIPFLIEQRINSAETPAGGGAALRDNERERERKKQGSRQAECSQGQDVSVTVTSAVGEAPWRSETLSQG